MVARAEAEADIAEQRRVAEEQRTAREAHERAAITEISDPCARMAAGDLASRLDEAGKDGFLLTMSPRLNGLRSEEHTSEIQSLMRISYAVFCLKKKT